MSVSRGIGVRRAILALAGALAHAQYEYSDTIRKPIEPKADAAHFSQVLQLETCVGAAFGYVLILFFWR